MITTVIFDMDGVLVDSEPIHRAVNQDFFREIGFPVSDRAYEARFVGLPLRDMFVCLGKDGPLPDSVEALTRACSERILKGFEVADMRAAPGVELLLEELRGRGCHLAVGSSSTPELIALMLEKIGLKSRFHHLVSGYEVSRGKPHPDLFLHIAERFGSAPGECLVLEDSTLGVEASRRAGMKTIGIRNVSSATQDLRGADAVAEDFTEEGRRLILDFLEGRVPVPEA